MPSKDEFEAFSANATEAYDFFVFDCDGVILDSNSVKTEAFREVALPFGEAAAESLVAHHVARGGETRHEKLDAFVREILGQREGADPELIARLVGRFAEICRQRLSQCDAIAGAADYLERVSDSRPCYVVTGGHPEEVSAALTVRRLVGHFEKILGNPATKRANMESLEAEGRLMGRGLYFGDAALDHELATDFGLDFCFVAGKSDWTDGRATCEPDSKSIVVENFVELIR